MTITKDTKLIVSFSAKQNSLGAAMHNAAYVAIGENALYVPITTNDIQNAIAGVRGFNLRGNTVSMPHKQAVMQYLDKIDPIAEAIGAVNTVSNDGGVLTGYNSDWVGAMNALKEVTKLEGKRVAVIGAGGAARAIIYGLLQNKAKPVVFNRDTAKAESLANDLGAEFGGDLARLKTVDDYDIVINATPVGSLVSGVDECIVTEDFFKPSVVAMDVITVPADTKFLQYAKAKGAMTVPGYRMLIHQALFQLELFTGKKAPFEVMEKALLEALGN
ncbi:MAG TPA: shikimate dehydrogenase [Candidatus Chromulinivoraceae bacterium]|nr:shikimate dehydrogenase [Candidatus Chromulinivoraceae bacterium]